MGIYYKERIIRNRSIIAVQNLLRAHACHLPVSLEFLTRFYLALGIPAGLAFEAPLLEGEQVAAVGALPGQVFG